MLHELCTRWEKPIGSDGDEFQNNMMQPLPNTPVLEGLTGITIKKGANPLNCVFPDGTVFEEGVKVGHSSFCANHPDNSSIPLISCPTVCSHVKGEPLEVENPDGTISTIYNYYQSVPL